MVESGRSPSCLPPPRRVVAVFQNPSLTAAQRASLPPVRRSPAQADAVLSWHRSTSRWRKRPFQHPFKPAGLGHGDSAWFNRRCRFKLPPISMIWPSLFALRRQDTPGCFWSWGAGMEQSLGPVAAFQRKAQATPPPWPHDGGFSHGRQRQLPAFWRCAPGGAAPQHTTWKVGGERPKSGSRAAPARTDRPGPLGRQRTAGPGS